MKALQWCREWGAAHLSLRPGHRVGAALALLVLLAVAVAGCSGSSTAGSDSGGDELPTVSGDPIPPITILGPSQSYDPRQYETMQVIGESLQEIGLSVDYQGVPDFGTFADTASQANFDIAAAGYLGTLPRLDPSLLMGTPFLCDAGPDSNFSGYCNEEYDRLYDESMKETDFDKRHEQVAEMQQILADDLPMIVPFNPKPATIYNSANLTDVSFNPASEAFNFRTFMNANPSDGVLTIGNSERGQAPNPMCNSGGYFIEQEVQTVMYDTLVRLNADGTIENWAAEDLVVDGPNLTFKLRPDMAFHDGKPVTAKDVVFTLNYLKEWEVGQYLDFTERIKSVEATDDLTVEVTLDQPFAPLGSWLAQIPILPEHIWANVVEEQGLDSPCDWKNPDYTGSGPYVFGSFSANQAFRLTRNDDYFQPPVAKELVVRHYSTQQSLFLDLMAGNIVMTAPDEGFTPSQIKEVQGNEELTVETNPSITVRWMSFNVREGTPFADLALRQAVAHLVDYDMIVQSILQDDGTAGAGVIAPANELWHNGDIEWPQYDVAAARTILADAGYGVDDSGALVAPEGGSAADGESSE